MLEIWNPALFFDKYVWLFQEGAFDYSICHCQLKRKKKNFKIIIIKSFQDLKS